MADQEVIAARNALAAGEEQDLYNAARGRLVALGGFSDVNGGLVDRILLSILSILRDPRLLAESTRKDISRYIGDYNKANPTFGRQLDSTKSIFIHTYAHYWRMHRARGNSMAVADIIAATANIDAAAIQAARQDMQTVDSLLEREEQPVAALELGTKFAAWLLALRVLLSGLVGAFSRSIVYLTVPRNPNPMHRT